MDGCQYVHGDSSVVAYVSKYGDESTAMLRAKILQDYHISQGNTPIDSNPVTFVDKLVTSLREWYRYYSYED